MGRLGRAVVGGRQQLRGRVCCDVHRHHRLRARLLTSASVRRNQVLLCIDFTAPLASASACCLLSDGIMPFNVNCLFARRHVVGLSAA